MERLKSYVLRRQLSQTNITDHPEFSALLDSFPEAVLVLDSNKGQVLHVNKKLLELTAFSEEEVCGEYIDKLFSDKFPGGLAPGKEYFTKLKRRRRRKVPVALCVNTMGVNEKLLLITAAPIEENQQQPIQDLNDKLQCILELSRLFDCADLDSSLENAVEVVKFLIDTDLVGIYIANGAYPILRRGACFDPSKSLPDTLPSTDMVKHSKTAIWVPGKRAMTEIQRFGRSANLMYIASTPLGQKDAFNGLLVVGCLENQPDDYIAQLLDILGANIGSIIFHQIKMNNLQIDVVDKQKSLFVKDELIENMPVGILVLSPDMKVVDINPAMELMLGYTNSEVFNQPVEDILVGPDLLPRALEEASRGISIHGLGNVRLHQRNGESLDAQVQIIPLQKDSELAFVLVYVIDVSEHERIKIKTQQLEHRAFLSEFTSIFAHEVRNPVNNIFTGTQLLSSRLYSDDPNLDIVNRIMSDCDRLEHLVESFLSFSKAVDRSKFEEVDMDRLFKRILDKWQPRFARVGVKPFYQSTEDLPFVHGDRRALERVFINLISNSVAAMEETGGTLSIKAALNEMIVDTPQLEITVSDTGPGIPDDVRDQIFEPFITTNKDGIGLGLSIIKQIITDHRGSISVNSFPGGTVFHVYLPVNNGAY